MLRILLAASLVLLVRDQPQDMPVTRPAGSVAGSAAPQPAPAPARPAPGQLPPLPATRIDQRTSGTSIDAQLPLSLSFSAAMPISDVLRLLVEGTAFSLAIDPDATGSFRGELKRLTLRQALTTLLTPLGLDFSLQGTIIRVMRHRSETREYDVNLLNLQRGLHRSTVNPGATASISTTAGGDDVFESIARGVGSLLSPAGRVNIDRRSGLALVSDFPERLDRVGVYLEALQARAGRQVRLEARVFEVTLRDAPSIDWALVREKLGLPRTTPEAGVAADPFALRNALAAQGEIEDLWAPDVTTLNNEPAIVHVSTQGASLLTMTVVPQISADGVVQLSIAHEWESHGARGPEPGAATPAVRLSGADTVTRVNDGSTVIISGLSRPVEFPTGVAGLTGGAPRHTGHAELVVLLRPTVVRARSTAGGQ